MKLFAIPVVVVIVVVVDFVCMRGQAAEGGTSVGTRLSCKQLKHRVGEKFALPGFYLIYLTATFPAVNN